MPYNSRHVCPTWQVQGLDLPPWLFILSPSTFAGVTGNPGDSGDLGLDRKMSSHLCRWLGLPCSLSSAALYGVLERKISSTDIWQAEAQQIKSMVQTVYDVLPNPANLHICGESDSPAYPLCTGKGSGPWDMFSSCPTALGHYG